MPETANGGNEIEQVAESSDNMAVKYLREQDGGAVVGGYIAPWGNPEKKDLQGDYFTPETETWANVYKSTPALFHHGLDNKMGLTVIGHRVKAEPDEIGLWVEDWLDVSSEYWRMVKPLLDAKALFYSPGSASHLVRRAEDGKLLSYPIVEDTLTVTPAQHRLRPVEQIKAAYKAANLDFPAEADEGGDDGGPSCQDSDEVEMARAKAKAIALQARIKRQHKE